MSTSTAVTGFASRSIGAIAAGLPGTTAVFRRHKLDFCCGGQAALGEAVGAERLPLIEAELAVLGAPPSMRPCRTARS